MDLKEIAAELREILQEKRQELNLTFIEDKHIYKMKDIDGKIKMNYPSVTKILKNFFKPFDKYGVSLSMARGDIEEQKRILDDWELSGKVSRNLGTISHFELEKYLIEQYDNYKKIRQPKFEFDDEILLKSDLMINAGKQFLSITHERNSVLLDTEVVLGSPIEGYVGQADNVWLALSKNGNLSFYITDYKTNKPKNFEVHDYNDNMFSPFEDYPNISLTHYYIQIPLYGRLLLKMLENTKYQDINFAGGFVVLLKEDGSYVEYKVPKDIVTKTLSMDLTNYLKK
jgi:hypothetical protein